MPQTALMPATWAFALSFLPSMPALPSMPPPPLMPVSLEHAGASPELFGVPIEFILFGLTLLGVARSHDHTLRIALTGLASITLYKLIFNGFHGLAGFSGLLTHLGHEWVMLANLLGLLLGFAILARHFEQSQAPEILPHYLPNDWTGGLMLLALVFVLSAFLDNIAAALIGGTVAATVYHHRLHIGYLAAIVAAANAGGAGSVLGDTTTTMMWIDGVAPTDVMHAFVGSVAAFLVFAVIAARQQAAYMPIQADATVGARLDWPRLAVVGLVLLVALATNLTVNTHYPELSERFPFLGVAVWVALLVAAPLRSPDWKLLPGAGKSSLFLLSLVLSASMMPVEALPAASWQTALGLGFVSAWFDNIPLTALALDQGGYDWGVLAYAVGFGGSMVWFGSSAGVALSGIFPEMRSVGDWLKRGWHIIPAFLFGFFVMLALVGWHPHMPHKPGSADRAKPEAAFSGVP